MLRSNTFEEFLDEFNANKKMKWIHSKHGDLDLVLTDTREVIFRASNGIWVYVNAYSYKNLKRKLKYLATENEHEK